MLFFLVSSSTCGLNVNFPSSIPQKAHSLCEQPWCSYSVCLLGQASKQINEDTQIYHLNLYVFIVK